MKSRRVRKDHKKQVIFLILSIEVLLIISGLAYIELRPMVVKAVTIEAGQQKIDVAKFLIYKNRQGDFITDVSSINTNIPGEYPVQIRIGRKLHTSLLKVVDTIPPKAKVMDQLVLCGEELKPNSFVTDITDETPVKVYFKRIPDTTEPGDLEVSLLLQDSGGNITEKQAMLTVLNMKGSIFVEAGSEPAISVGDFIGDEKYKVSLITDLSTINYNEVGSYPIEIDVNGRIVTGTIEVKDTIAPIAEVKEQKVWKGDAPDADIFVADITDHTKVTVSYQDKPDFTKLGEKSFTVVLKDEGGNITELPITAEVVEDQEPPEISGASDKIVFLGDSISYKKDVTVKDNRDKEVKLSVDSSGVNLKKEGTYTVTYSATDSSGNTATKEIILEVRKFVATESVVNELCDSILEKITNTGISKRDTAYAIYKWVRGHIDYTGDSDKSDWLAEAYRGMTKQYGDCFTYFAVTQALLTRAGIDNMEVNRVGGRTRHYWSLVNCGDGWYHLDSCPNKDHKDSFMLTDQEVEELTRIRGNNYYNFDESLYPATPSS